MGDMELEYLLNSLETRLGFQEEVKRMMDKMDMVVVYSLVGNYGDLRKDLGKGNTDEGAEQDKGYENKKVKMKKNVFLDSEGCDKTEKLKCCGEIHLGDRRWIHRRHVAYQAVVGEDLEACPLESTGKRGGHLNQLSRRFPNMVTQCSIHNICNHHSL